MTLAVYTGGHAHPIGSHRRLGEHDVLPGDLHRALAGVEGLVVLDPLSFPFEALDSHVLDRPLVVSVGQVDTDDLLALRSVWRLLGPGDGVVGVDHDRATLLPCDAADVGAVIEAAEELVASDSGRKARRRAEAAALGWVVRQEARAVGVDTFVDLKGGFRALGWPPRHPEPVDAGSPVVVAVRPTESLRSLSEVSGPGGRLIRLMDGLDRAALESATLIRSVLGDHPSIVSSIAT